VKEPIQIQYRDFYDIPRVFVAELEGVRFLFDCPFNEELDDYPDAYDVFVLPRLTREDLDGSWAGLSGRAIQHLGRVPTTTVVFDDSRRKTIEASVLRDLKAALPFLEAG
jgi:hypothetical protein